VGIYLLTSSRWKGKGINREVKNM